MTQNFATGSGGTTNTTSNQFLALQAYGADRTLDNSITLDPTVFGSTNQFTIDPIVYFVSTKDDQISGATAHRTFTLNGTVTVNGGAILRMGAQIDSLTISGNPAAVGRDGSGDVVFNGNILLNDTTTRTLEIGEQVAPGPSAGAIVGRQIFNGNILEQNAARATSCPSAAEQPRFPPRFS